MELLALVIFNIVFGIILYYIISLKVSTTVKDYQNQKLKKEIQEYTLQFFKESENYLSLLDSKITILKNLLQKAESMGLDLSKESRFELKPKDNSYQKFIEKETSKNQEKFTPNLTKSTVKSDASEVDSELGFVGSLGKLLRSLLGVTPLENTQNPSRVVPPKPTPIKHIDMSVGGNPFEEGEKVEVKDNLLVSEGEEFANYLTKTLKSSPKVPVDKVKISISTALSELPENTSKVDKVVYLLKKGYSHVEISEELELALPEISLIETLKMERGRRN